MQDFGVNDSFLFSMQCLRRNTYFNQAKMIEKSTIFVR